MFARPIETVYEVTGLRQLTAGVREVRAKPVGRPLSFAAGQYALVCDAERLLPARSFSLAGTPRLDGHITLLVTRYPGGVISGWVHERMRPGDRLLLDGPYGTLLAPPGAALLLVSAGSGLAPIRALAGQSLADDPAADVLVVTSARTDEDVVDRDQLDRWSAIHPRFRWQRTLTRAAGPAPTGRLPDQLADLVPDLAARQVFIAGPDAFVTACAVAARAAGAPAGAVHTEEYYADPTPWSGPMPTTMPARG